MERNENLTPINKLTKKLGRVTKKNYELERRYTGLIDQQNSEIVNNPKAISKLSLSTDLTNFTLIPKIKSLGKKFITNIKSYKPIKDSADEMGNLKYENRLIKGHIYNSTHGPTFSPIIQGWLAKIGDNNPRTALLVIDERSFEIKCDSYRADLKMNKINQGNHAFGFIIPSHLADGEKRSIKLYDKESEKLVAKKDLTFNENVRTISTNENLKNALKGNDNYLFLINDSSCELRQHFDDSYKSSFNAEVFIDNFNYKKKYCEDRGIKYYFFIVPDKSIVCKELLPFETEEIKRNYDSIKDLVPDFSSKLDPKYYFKNDTHINYYGGVELTYYFLNHINKNFQKSDLDKLMDEQITTYNEFYNGDLTNELNWSYTEEEKDVYLQEETVIYKNKIIKNINDELPDKFKKHQRRGALFYRNEKSFSELRVLILRDSSLNILANTLATYFKEMLLYWDHWDFNQEIVDWYKPDFVLEIRTERFLEHMERFL